MQVKPTSLRDILIRTIPARMPILITGSPGIGKTDIVHQAASAVGADLLVVHMVVKDPTDFSGLPWPENGHAKLLPIGDLRLIKEAQRPLVVLLDDFGQASTAVQAVAMQMVLARRIGEHIIPDHVVFIAATNRRQDRAGVSGILEPVKSRFILLELVPTVEDFAAWAMAAGKRPEVIAFIRFRSELLNKFDPTAEMVNSPCPRTWSKVSDILDLNLPRELELPMFAGAVGEGAALEFINFLQAQRDLPRIEDILASPDTAPIPTSMNLLYAVAVGLAMKATAANFPKVLIYAQRLLAAGHAEFGVLLIRDSFRRDPLIAATPAFATFSMSDLGKLVTGSIS
jgi:hypothetical protein